MAKFEVTIPRADEKEVAIIREGNIGFQRDVKKRFEKIDQLLFAIIAAVIVSLVAVVIAVIGLFLDQIRYNNAAYREYSERLEINELLLEQNKQNQEFILQYQE